LRPEPRRKRKVGHGLSICCQSPLIAYFLLAYVLRGTLLSPLVLQPRGIIKPFLLRRSVNPPSGLHDAVGRKQQEGDRAARHGDNSTLHVSSLTAPANSEIAKGRVWTGWRASSRSGPATRSSIVSWCRCCGAYGKLPCRSAIRRSAGSLRTVFAARAMISGWLSRNALARVFNSAISSPCEPLYPSLRAIEAASSVSAQECRNYLAHTGYGST